MGLNGCRLAAIAACAAALFACRPAAGQLYSENFVGTAGASLTPVGWDNTSTTSSGIFDATGNAISNEAVTPDGLDTGVVYHFLNANGVQAIWTTEFSPINPAAGPGIDISWWQTEQNSTGASTVDVHPAVQVGGQWYASQRAFSTTDSQSPWRRQLFTYDATKTNWLSLTLGTGSATLGAAPAANLSGNVTGLGLVTVMNSAPVGAETVWYDYIEIAAHVIPGDVNGVGGVTIDDYNIIKANYRTNVTTRAQGDLNRDGVVDILDFREWKANFPGAASIAGLTIPEPAGGSLAMAGAALGWLAKRRAQRQAKASHG